MDAAVEKMEKQLKLSSLRIEDLAARTQKAGIPARFDDLTYIDELKVLQAVAQSKLDEFKAAGGAEQGRLKAEMTTAWNDLEAAFKNRIPPFRNPRPPRQVAKG